MSSTRALRALPLMSALILTACGGGSGGGTPPPQMLPDPPKAVEPVALDSAPFVTRARVEACSDLVNKLYVIDNQMVLSDRAGNCADNADGQVLYGAKVDTILCQAGDTIAGRVVSCKDETRRALFDTMRANLNKADLGLGTGHTVKPVPVLPRDGTLVRYAHLTVEGGSAITEPKQVVVRDAAALAALWAEHSTYTTPAAPLPKVDFSTHMVLGSFAGKRTGCHAIGILRVLVSGDKLVAEYGSRDLTPPTMCASGQTVNMELVTVPRSDAQVEFRKLDTAPFTRLDGGQNSGYVSGPANLVIKDAAAWNVLWTQHASVKAIVATGDVMPAPPAVDFSRDMVVAVFMGGFGNGCYHINVQGIVKAADKLEVRVMRFEPGLGAICTANMTSPYDIVVTPRSDLPVQFYTQTRYFPEGRAGF